MDAGRLGTRLAFVVALSIGSLVPPGDLLAEHYSWVGHKAEVPPNSTELGEFVPTFYRILDEAAPEWASQARGETLMGRDGRPIASVAPAFRRQLDIEGSARLRDGRIVNIADRVGGSLRYLIASGAPFGVGAPGFKLIPYRTVAVDPRRIKLGTVLYLPVLAGIALPSGEIHDGFCFAHDTGKGIVGNRIDVFVGFESDLSNALSRSNRITSHKAVRMYRVEGETARAVNARFKKEFTWNE
jgi:3D (Asp-Asp-Asp) domain-containing protein